MEPQIVISLRLVSSVSKTEAAGGGGAGGVHGGFSLAGFYLKRQEWNRKQPTDWRASLLNL